MREFITDELLLDVMTRIAADRVGYKAGVWESGNIERAAPINTIKRLHVRTHVQCSAQRAQRHAYPHFHDLTKFGKMNFQNKLNVTMEQKYRKSDGEHERDIGRKFDLIC